MNERDTEDDEHEEKDKVYGAECRVECNKCRHAGRVDRIRRAIRADRGAQADANENDRRQRRYED